MIKAVRLRRTRTVGLRACALLLCACASMAAAQETWVVAVADVPGFIKHDGDGPLLTLVEALDRELPDVSLKVRLVPFVRSVLLTQQGAAQIQIPFVGLPDQAPAGLRAGGESLGDVRFALYIRRQQRLDTEAVLAPSWRLSEQGLRDIGMGEADRARFSSMLGHSWRRDQLEAVPGAYPGLAGLGYPYHIETDRAHVQALGFPGLPSSSVSSSLEKLSRGRIQAYVFASSQADEEIERLGLRNQLRAQHFADYPATWLVAEGAAGAAIDQRLGAALRALQASGEYPRIRAELLDLQRWQAVP